jgi:hypothetical protein
VANQKGWHSVRKYYPLPENGRKVTSKPKVRELANLLSGMHQMLTMENGVLGGGINACDCGTGKAATVSRERP